MSVRIRPALQSDADAICDIHNQGIVDRVATLDTTLRTPEGCREWLAGRDERHPVIVAEAGEGVPPGSSEPGVIGWASLNRFNPREAYDHVVDFSVYVARDWRGKHVGSGLLADLVERATALGYHKMVLAALARNEAGVALYAKAGFSHVGIYREQGQLDGQWVDVVVMEKLLDRDRGSEAHGSGIEDRGLGFRD
jgi:phosphinothricin acetyltransferase